MIHLNFHPFIFVLIRLILWLLGFLYIFFINIDVLIPENSCALECLDMHGSMIKLTFFFLYRYNIPDV
jgi:hypothetical protein